MAIRKKPVLTPGTRIGKYEIVQAAGSGNMGAVYEARNTSLEKRVALKVLHQTEAMKDEVVARLVREGRTASRIRHPHVVEVYDVDTHEGVPYLVMEFLVGEDLSAQLARKGPMSVERIADIMLPVIAGVAAAHEQGVVHRDLKPENIFLTTSPDGFAHPKVLDFGVSKVMSVLRVTALTRPGVILGTPIYMSPEQLMASKNADARSDQFSIGVILYELATGKRPFVATMIFDLFNAIRDGRCLPPREHVPSLPASFEAVVLRALKPTPADRFASMAALGQALLPFAGDRARSLWEPVFVSAAAQPPPEVARDSSLILLAGSLGGALEPASDPGLGPREGNAGDAGVASAPSASARSSSRPIARTVISGRPEPLEPVPARAKPAPGGPVDLPRGVVPASTAAPASNAGRSRTLAVYAVVAVVALLVGLAVGFSRL